MAKIKTKAIFMPFKEIKFDNEGNPMFDKKTGEPVYQNVKRIVRHNAMYYPNK